ncbi:hypothetical protein [Candidatus Arthromitus sp. SFB-rat-Yit]|uniref:hypothetical protein n=1 Tax=Candidatus Arthromitus sp. SFB-rat-Yit TaxID=1041504 RepID=UPI000227A281|nr:hypothetical protein [Candidatus Arthromitus sp. SFB-rat-Yit]BAK81417.1 FG-GAP repeat protein [Candidatus Arthromitus sp. SFB-rat-Yit]
MKITKKKLDDIKRCYAVSSMNYDGVNHYIFASEDPDVICESFKGENFEFDCELWKKAGGCMSLIPIPNKEKEFLAIQEFYMKVSPSLAKVVWGKLVDGKWEYKDILQIPYIHRFDIYRVGDVNYFIVATIAELKDNKEDWSRAGKIYVGVLPESPEEELKVEVLRDGMFRNHGYSRDYDSDGSVCGYFGCDDGLYKVKPPKNLGGEWSVEKVMDGMVGEVSLIDIDNDGVKEIMTIEAFHGNKIHIHKMIDGEYKKVYTYENEIDFAHSLTSGTLRGVPTFIAGVRRIDAELFYVQYVDGKFVTNIIDKGVGPANLHLVNEGNRDLILSANHTANEAVVYIVED